MFKTVPLLANTGLMKWRGTSSNHADFRHWHRCVMVSWFGKLAYVGLLSLALRQAGFAQASQFLVQSFPTGSKPLGLDISGDTLQEVTWVAVANSAGNSVSIFKITPGGDYYNANGTPIATANLVPVGVISGIPSPYAVAGCGAGQFLVTSPSANLVSLVDATKGTVVKTISVGPQPYSVDCFDSPGSLVSNYGDNSLSVLDPTTFEVKNTIPNVPGSRGLHGITVVNEGGLSHPVAWVAGTDGNVITLVDLSTLSVLTHIPIPNPTSLQWQVRDGSIIVASSSSNSVVTFGSSTLTITSTISNVQSPQDVAGGGLGTFATLGTANAVARLGTNTELTGIPGAAALSQSAVPLEGVGPVLAGDFLLVTSTDSNSLFLIQPTPTLPIDFTASNGASFQAVQLASGSLASAFVATGVKQNFSAGSVPLPQTLGGVVLSIGGTLSFDTGTGWTNNPVGSIQAPLLFVGPNQINFQIPPGVPPGSAVPVQLTKPDGTTRLTTLDITPAAPGIFTVLQNGQGQAAVLNQDNSQNFGTNPAPRGSVIQIFATGAGETTPPLLPGEAAPASGNPLVVTNVKPFVKIGGQPATVLFSGMAPGFVGLWQIDAQIPDSVQPGLAVPLVISAGNATSNTATIAVQ